MRHKHLINAFAVITAGSLNLSAFILPSQARSQGTPQPCEIALLNAENRIEQGRDIIVEIDIRDGSEGYPDHPDGRPTIIWIAVDGSAADSVMVSPVFQQAIASEIIKSCNSVGAVAFNRSQTGWSSRVGLMRDGNIQHFECAEDHIEDYNIPFPSEAVRWGLQWCTL